MSNYQIIINCCKRGDIRMAINLMFDFYSQDNSFDVTYAKSIIDRYNARIAH